MSYESRLYIINNTRASYDPNRKMYYGEVIAMYDICAFPPIRKMFEKCKPTDCFIYADDADTAILKDFYDKPLTEASVDKVISCLEKVRGEDAAYRRVLPLLALLRAFRDTESQWAQLAVLHFGH